MLIYDIEIHKAIPSSREQCEPGVEYCNGWEDYAGMGIAVVGCHDYKTDAPRVFCEDNLTELKMLMDSQECIVGFNNHRFDDRVLEASGILISREKSYDILQEVWRGLGLGPDYAPNTHSGYSLQAMCRANFKLSKCSNGAMAPIQWQRREVGGVIDYCLRDVYLTRKLLDRIIRCGALVDPKDARKRIQIRKPGATWL